MLGTSTNEFLEGVTVSLRDSVRGVAISVSPIDVKEMDESRFSKTSWDMMTGPLRPLPGLFMDETLNWLNLMSASSLRRDLMAITYPTEEVTEPNLWRALKVLKDEIPTRLEIESTAPL